MKTYKPLIAIGLVLGLIALVINLLWVNIFCSVPVAITNQGTGRITNLVLGIRGDTKTLPDLMPGETRTVTLEPKTETQIDLAFVDSSGGAHKESALYLGRHLGGRANVVIDSAGKGTWTHTVKTCLF